MTSKSFSGVLLALIMLAGSVSCSKVEDYINDVGWNELGGDRMVSFFSGVATKTIESLPNNTSFGVFAFTQTGTNNTPGAWPTPPSADCWTPNLMYNRQVSFNGSTYTYSPVETWPRENTTTISFWSYYPYNDPANGISFVNPGLYSTYTDASVGVPDIRFTSDGHTDLMVSDIVPDKTYSNCTPVPGQVKFTFDHALSLIDFKVRKINNTYDIDLTSIRLDAIYATAIYRNGTYQSSPGSGEKHFNSPSWNGWSGSRQNIGVYSDHQTVTTDMSTVVSSGNTADAMVIPQTLVGTEARLRIVYTITYNNVSWENIYTAEFSGNWAAGKHYTYSITINPPNIPIEFTVLEAQWTAWGTSHDYEINLNQ